MNGPVLIPICSWFLTALSDFFNSLLGPQCDRSKILCRTATHLETEVNIETGVVDLRGDETKMNL